MSTNMAARRAACRRLAVVWEHLSREMMRKKQAAVQFRQRKSRQRKGQPRETWSKRFASRRDVQPVQDAPAAARAMPTQTDQPMPLEHSLESPQPSSSWGFREMKIKLSAVSSTVSKKRARLSDPLESSESDEGEETTSESEQPTTIVNLNEIKKMILFTACRECGNSLELIVDGQNQLVWPSEAAVPHLWNSHQKSSPVLNCQ